MTKLAIVTSGFLPVPATQGGAVENLIENFMKKNESHKLKITIFSIYDEKAIEESKKYQNTKITFIKTPSFIKVLDKFIFLIVKNILKKNNSQSYRYIIQRLNYLFKVSKILKKEDYDKVLLENHPTQYLALRWYKNYLKYKNKYYYHCHNELPGTYSCLNIIKGTKKIICVSDFIKDNVSKYLDCQKNVCVLRNGIDEEKFKKKYSDKELDSLKKKYNIKKTDIVLIFTGRIVPEKGILPLIQAIKKLKYNNFKLLVLGSSVNALKIKTKYQEELEQLLLDEKIKNKIIFTGYINYNDIPKYYQIANIGIVPSLWNDPAPLSVIEAITVGLPIITTKSGGIPEYVNDKCAIVLNIDDNLVNNLATSIDKLLGDQNLIKKMSKESLKLSKDLTIENYYNNFIKILDEENDKR